MTDALTTLEQSGWVPPPVSEDGVRYASQGNAAISYPVDGFAAFGLEGGTGYWFDHRAEAVSRYLTGLRVTTMWEVGSGTGAMARRLAASLDSIVTVEPIAEGARAAAALGLTSICGTLQDLELPANSLDCVGAFDVIEHLSHPDAFLDEVHRVLRPRGLVIVTVPAHPFLWGDEDDFAGHQRRYTKSTLRTAFKNAGFSAVRVEYLYASLVAPAAAARALPYRLGRRRSSQSVRDSLQSQLTVQPAVDRWARRILKAEARLAKVATLPFGLSLLGAFQAA